MKDNKINIEENSDNKIKKDNFPKINNNIKIENNKSNGYNKVIKALLYNDNNDKKENINNINNDNNDPKKNHKIDEFKENFYKYNFEKSEGIESLSNLLLVKNTIGQENIEPMNKFLNRPRNNINNKIYKVKLDNNLIESKEEEKENENFEKIENKNNDNNYIKENNKKEEKGELDLTYNFDDDVFNVTQQQMDILDGDVNRIYNRYKNNIEKKYFKMNHPYLKNKNTMIDNNLDYGTVHMSKEERQKRLSPIIEKQKLILERIKKDNISRSNLSSSNNNDSDNQTKNKINKSNKKFYPYELSQLNNNSNGNLYSNMNQRSYNNYIPYPFNNFNTLELNNNINSNKNLNLPNYQNNNILRYQNFYNNRQYISENRSIISSNDKININKENQRKIIYEPYTLIDYKKKYEKSNRERKLLGGLGANIGGEEWVNRQKRLERKRQYSEYVKSDNEEDFKKQNQIKFKLKNEKMEITKTVSSKKSSAFSSDRLTEPISKKNKYIKTENNIISSKQIKLPLIKERFRIQSNNNNKNNIKSFHGNSNSNKKFKLKENFESELINPINPINGNEKDLKELIKQYEEYNGKF